MKLQLKKDYKQFLIISYVQRALQKSFLGSQWTEAAQGRSPWHSMGPMFSSRLLQADNVMMMMIENAQYTN